MYCTIWLLEEKDQLIACPLLRVNKKYKQNLTAPAQIISKLIQGKQVLEMTKSKVKKKKHIKFKGNNSSEIEKFIKYVIHCNTNQQIKKYIYKFKI